MVGGTKSIRYCQLYRKLYRIRYSIGYDYPARYPLKTLPLLFEPRTKCTTASNSLQRQSSPPRYTSFHSPACRLSDRRATESPPQRVLTILRIHYSNSRIKWKMQRTLRMRERSVMRSCGLYFKSHINVSKCAFTVKLQSCSRNAHWCSVVKLGSRYIYDLYYEKDAISKKLYDWLLKNNYADANLIAKWKKQGYEKVMAIAAWLPRGWVADVSTHSSAA